MPTSTRAGRQSASIAPSQVTILRPRDAAAALGVGRSTLYQMIGRGELRLMKLGARSVGIRSDDIAAWIVSRPTVKIAPPPKQAA